MSRVPWQSRIFDVDPGSFNNYENVPFFGYFLFFVKIFDFSRTNWYYRLKGISKSYHPWKNEYIWMCGLENLIYGCYPDWRVLCVFWPYWMNHSSKSICLTKMIFWISKEILQDYLPWKSQLQSFSGSWNMPASVFWEFWMIQKIFFKKKFFSTQNRSIRVKNMFSRFSIFFS